jgi:ribosomal protein S18 acetylase RimI-like enzyme
MSAGEAMMWCGRPIAPVPAEEIRAWAREDGVQPYGLYDDGRLVAYGELWVNDDEDEVELARLVVDPDERGHGLGRRLVAELLVPALGQHARVFMRVHPDNAAALRCYAAAGFEPAGTDQAAGWNRFQPVAYVWLTLAAR